MRNEKSDSDYAALTSHISFLISHFYDRTVIKLPDS